MSMTAVGHAIVTAMVIDNLLLYRGLGFDTYLCVYHRPEGTRGSLVAAALVSLLAVAATSLGWPLNRYFLQPYNAVYLQPLVFIFLTAILSQTACAFGRLFPVLHRVLSLHGPFVFINSMVLGTILLASSQPHLPGAPGPGWGDAVLYAFASAVGYWLALGLVDSIRARVELAGVPRSLAGLPMTLLIAGLVGMVLLAAGRGL